MKRNTNVIRSFAGILSKIRYVSRSAQQRVRRRRLAVVLPRLIRREEEQPLAPGLPPDVRAGGEHRNRRQPAPHLIDVLQLADPIDGPDEDLLQEIGNLGVRPSTDCRVRWTDAAYRS